MGSLPFDIKTPELWDKHAKQHDIKSTNIYQLKHYDSASKIEDPQYLALRAIWNLRRRAQFKPQQWGLHIRDARQKLADLSHWKNYLRAIPKRVPVDKILPIKDDLGDFKHVWYYQQLILWGNSAPDLEDNLNFTPVAKRTRRTANQNLVRESQKGAEVRSITNTLLGVRIEDPEPEPETHNKSSIPRTPSISSSSSKSLTEGLSAIMDDSTKDPDYKEEEDETFPSVSDENVVNTGFVSFANVLTYSIAGVKAHWSQERKGFKVGEIDGIKLYEARTDGHLFLPNDKHSKAIIEVKPMMRIASARVRMQEAAQMAAWIHVERDIDIPKSKGKKPEQKRYVPKIYSIETLYIPSCSKSYSIEAHYIFLCSEVIFVGRRTLRY